LVGVGGVRTCLWGVSERTLTQFGVDPGIRMGSVNVAELDRLVAVSDFMTVVVGGFGWDVRLQHRERCGVVQMACRE